MHTPHALRAAFCLSIIGVYGLVPGAARAAPGSAPAALPPAVPISADEAGAEEAAKTATSKIASKAGADGAVRAFNINSLESGTLLQIINKAFDTETDAINPEKGTFSWKGHTYDLGQFRVFRARFERYLALPPTRDDDAYRAAMDEITDLLSTRNAERAQGNIVDAWSKLYHIAEFDSDGGSSLGIANQVFNAWRIRDEKEAFRVTQTELERMRKQQQASVVYSGDAMAAKAGKAASDTISSAAILGNLRTGDSTSDSAPANGGTNNGPSNGSGNGSKTSGDGNRSKGTTGESSVGQISGSALVGPVGQTLRARELVETELKLKANEGAALLTVIQAKVQFQSQIVSLFLQRRFQHCLIASAFYRYIFKGSQQNLEVGKKELASFLPSTDLAITVETLEFLSREALNDVTNSMVAVRANYDAGRLIGALERLQETFFLGEYLPAVTQLDPACKNQLLTLYRKVDEARKLADLKDYDAVLTLNDQIGAMSNDFRTAEVGAAVRSTQRMSTLALNAARQAAAGADYTRAQDLVTKAAQLWPLNPAIKNYSENMASQADIGTQAATLFDDAYKREDYRQIFEKRAELAVAFLNDPARGGQFKTVIDKMSRVEIFLAQADELLAQNNAFAAWEALATASTFAPNDVPVNQRRARLAPRVAAFIGKLDQAQRDEEQKRWASSLTGYLAAQGVHPASQLARLGIQRTSEALLDQISPARIEGDAGAPASPPDTHSTSK